MADFPAQAEAETLAEQPYDTADPVQVNNRRKQAARLEREKNDVVASLMGQVAGRAWLYGKLELAHVFATSFTANDPHATSFKEGERNIGNLLLGDIMAAAPDQYVMMVREGKAPRK